MPIWRTPIGPRFRKTLDRSLHQVTNLGYRLLPGIKPGRFGIRVERDIPYRNTGKRSHRLDVYRPKVYEHRPVVLYVHGGAFSMLSKDTHRLMALMFARQGYVVFNTNYRLGPRHRYPAQLADVAAALLWVHKHAAQHGGDANNIVLAGESAGANLVTALAYIATHPRPEPFARAVFDRNLPLRAVLAIYGLHDMHDIERLWRRADKSRKMAWYVKEELVWAARSYVGHDPNGAPLASTLRLLEEGPKEGARPLPPFFLTAGTADPLLDDSRRLQRALAALDVDAELHVYPGEIHGFDAMLWRPAARAKWQAGFDFLARQIGAQPGATDDTDDDPLDVETARSA